MISYDRKEYSHYWYNTPMRAPECATKRRALAPGTSVKSYALVPAPQGPLCGRVHSNDSAGCVVIGYGWEDTDEEKFVWKGSKPEFDETWQID